MTAQFIDIRACIRQMKAGFDELRSSLAKQIRAGLAEIRSQTAVHVQRDYSMVYSRRQKRKSSVLEADVGVDDNMIKELFPNNSGAELPTIPEESIEDIQVTPDAVMSGSEATTSKGCDGVRSFVECLTFKVKNSWARVKASMLVSSPRKIKGFYDNYDKSFYRPMAYANSPVTICHMGEALHGLLEIQLRHPELMSPNVSLMNSHFYVSMSVVAEDENQILKTNVVGVVKGIDPEWPCVSWGKARIILIPVHTDGRWFLLKLVAGVNKCTIYVLKRKHDPKCKDLDEDIGPILINVVHLLSFVGNNPHPERSWSIKMYDEFKAQIKQYVIISLMCNMFTIEK
ncbi:uncharacterized protein [Henckelia pumila]|uniref:uncharacterized protein n=1 Tax=Henckelia pumila TaxID=405737 RepID=UPI003C6E7B20